MNPTPPPSRGKRIILARPRGFCSGVRRAVALAERLLQNRPKAGLFILGEIVHNPEVVQSLQHRGARLVRSLEDIPPGATVLFSAHGVAPAVQRSAQARGLQIADATCPFVQRLHDLVRTYAEDKNHILLIGRHGHEEVEGIVGESPGQITVLETTEEAESFSPPPNTRLAVVVQTTLSEEDIARVLPVLKKRFENLRFPSPSTVCQATRDRQNAVKKLAQKTGLVLVLGAANSSNSRRLVEVAKAAGARAALLASDAELHTFDLHNITLLGLTAGASTPDGAIERALRYLRSLGFDHIEEMAENDPTNGSS